MDPHENLAEQLRLADLILATPERDVAAVELAGHVRALDEWRRRGGFDPYRSSSDGLEQAVAAAIARGATPKLVVAAVTESLARHALDEAGEAGRG